MADIRINALATTATSSASDDYIAIDGAANGTRKLSVYSPTFGGNLTVSGGQIQMGGTNPYIQGTTGTGYIQFQNTGSVVLASNSSTLQFASNGSVQATLATSGNLLLGTTTDSSNGKLQLATHTTSAGGIGFGTSVSLFTSSANNFEIYCGGSRSLLVNSSGIYAGFSGSAAAPLWSNANGVSGIYYTSTGQAINFSSNGTLALTLDSSQNATFAGTVNSGTSTSSGYNNNKNVQLEGLSGRTIVNHNSGTASGSLYIGFGYNGSGLGSITQDSTTGVLYNTTSDARLKTNVRDLTGSGAIIDALLPRIFDWKSGDKDKYGFIAQEVFAVFPQAVKQGDDGEEITDQWAMDASKLVPVLVAEIKSLRSRLAAINA